MQVIAELVRFVSKFGGNLKGYGDKTNAVIRGVLDGRISSDEDAERLLYGSNPLTTARGDAYRQLKMSLKRKLISHASTLDTPSDSPAIRKVISSSYRQIRLARMLISVGSGSAAAHVLSQVNETASRWGLLDIKLCALSWLKQQAALQGAKKRHSEIRQQIRNTLAAIEAELFARDVYEKIIIENYRTAGFDERGLAEARSAMRRIEIDATQYKTRELESYRFLIVKKLAELQGDFQTAIDVIEEEREYYYKNPDFASPARIAALNLEAANACYQARKAEEGLESAALAFETFEEGGVNWLASAEALYLCAMHVGRFDAAGATLSAVAVQKRFKRASDKALRQKWEIYEVCYRLVRPRQLPNNVTTIPGARKWNAARFAATTAGLIHDKSGYNLARIMGTTAVLLREFAEYGEASLLDDLERAAESNKHYLWTRLDKRRKYYRTLCLIKFYYALVRDGFRLDRAESEAGACLDRLSSAEPGQGWELDTLEPLPAEKHVELAMEAVREINRKAFIANPVKDAI